MNGYKRRGFTLIELLVVIAVIAILAAILFPVFAAAREKARQTVCLSNLRQIGMATQMYVQDWDELPPYVDAANAATFNFDAPGAPTNFLGALLPYIKTEAIFLCPDAVDVVKSATPSSGAPNPYYCAGPPDCSSYAANAVVASHPLSAIPSPADIIWVQEASDRERAARYHPLRAGDLYYMWYQVSAGYHFGGENVLYLDGHAKWKRREALRAGDFGLVPSDEAPTFRTADYHKGWQAAF